MSQPGLTPARARVGPISVQRRIALVVAVTAALPASGSAADDITVAASPAPALAAGGPALGGPGPAARAVWVFFRQKAVGAPWPEVADLTAQASLDQPLDAEAVAAVLASGVHVRVRSRWFNALSVDATPGQQEALRRLPPVRRVRPVASLRRPGTYRSRTLPPSRRTAALDYGNSLAQNAAVGVPFMHQHDLFGQGVRIAVIDAGFNWRDQRAFAGLQVVAERDFINGDDDVGDEADEPVTGDEGETGQNRHGTRVLSVLAGRDPGQLIGVVPQAEFLLAKTDDVTPTGAGESEGAVEEDRWVAALEWADSLGADVVTSSLGYTEFDDGTGYTYADLDGATALTTRAAQLAVERGVVVVVAAGNEGNTAWHYITVPADAPGVLAVGGVDPVSHTLASFSSRGPTADGRIKPDVVAPGQQVWLVDGRAATAAEGRRRFALVEYTWQSGTSFAAPIVSGAAAQLLQLHPDWTPAQVGDALRGTATDLGPTGPDTLFGWGLIDVPRAAGLDVALPVRGLAGVPFPNPASTAVHFPIELAVAGSVSLSLFDVAGGLVGSVALQRLPPGRYTVPGLAPVWRLPDDLASGIYYYRIDGAGFGRTGKIAVVRGVAAARP